MHDSNAGFTDNPQERNEFPMADGLLYYFPAALAAVARVSKIGNDQHNPGQPLHWARGKSMDHANKIMRHLVDAGHVDSDGTLHSAKLAWRALALLQQELEDKGLAPLAPNARLYLPDHEEPVDLSRIDAAGPSDGKDTPLRRKRTPAARSF
jgi:hypothetical protein